MNDDIVERLRRWDDGRISTHYEGCWNSHPVCAILLAADAIEERDAEIVRLRAEVERLRAAGDALADNLRQMEDCYHSRTCKGLRDESTDNCTSLVALAAWNEARRGRE